VGIEFGSKPYRIKVNLAQDARFYQAIRSPAGQPAWPSDVDVELRFTFSTADPVTWQALVDVDDDHLLVFERNPAQVAEVRGQLAELVSCRWFSGDDYLGKAQVVDVT
jgi:hypothetical protein